MIDWYVVEFGALWVLELDLVVAALSFATYLAGRQKRQFRQALERSDFQIMIDLGLVFFCLEWAGIVSTLWERLLGAVLGLKFAVRTWQARKMSNV